MTRNSVIHKDSQIGKNVKIGSFCTIGANVSIDDNCIIHNNVIIDGNVKIKNNVEIFPFVSIGSIPQDLKYSGEKTKIFIDENCKIREFVTINLGTKGGGGITKIFFKVILNQCLLCLVHLLLNRWLNLLVRL